VINVQCGHYVILNLKLQLNDIVVVQALPGAYNCNVVHAPMPLKIMCGKLAKALMINGTDLMIITMSKYINLCT